MHHASNLHINLLVFHSLQISFQRPEEMLFKNLNLCFLASFEFFSKGAYTSNFFARLCTLPQGALPGAFAYKILHLWASISTWLCQKCLSRYLANVLSYKSNILYILRGVLRLRTISDNGKDTPYVGMAAHLHIWKSSGHEKPVFA